MSTFKPNATYTTRSIGDADCIIEARIVERTAKTVKARISGQPPKTFRLSVDYTGAE